MLFPTNPDLANILGDTDFDFENSFLNMFLDPTFPDFWISRFLDSQIQGCHLVIFGRGGLSRMFIFLQGLSRLARVSRIARVVRLLRLVRMQEVIQNITERIQSDSIAGFEPRCVHEKVHLNTLPFRIHTSDGMTESTLRSFSSSGRGVVRIPLGDKR